jgi:hypothetical protein
VEPVRVQPSSVLNERLKDLGQPGAAPEGARQLPQNTAERNGRHGAVTRRRLTCA